MGIITYKRIQVINVGLMASKLCFVPEGAIPHPVAFGIGLSSFAVGPLLSSYDTLDLTSYPWKTKASEVHLDTTSVSSISKHLDLNMVHS